jgi:hypothetical protein
MAVPLVFRAAILLLLIAGQPARADLAGAAARAYARFQKQPERAASRLFQAPGAPAR